MRILNKLQSLIVLLVFGCQLSVHAESTSFSGYEVSPEGAWCWFADPRAIHFQSKDGKIDRTFIGYIDVHGNIKAMQTDKVANKSEEVLIRSYFQPDDHNNPTFLVLPDERIMVFYSRHTDEPCFYYRVTSEPGDLTTLSDEKVIKTRNNTTYPSPFILSDDPNHIYLCWRGIKWHPTIGRLLIPDKNGDTNFDWGPYQMVQSTGARPYAKYAANGKDKIYIAYTTGHPDNEQPNYVYYNYIDINSLKLKDIKGHVLATIQDGPHHVNKSLEYAAAYPDAVVSDTSYRNWIWDIAVDSLEKPVIAIARISPDKKTHDYYRADWDGNKWGLTFLAHGGSHFHQSPEIENCYSGGMAINKNKHSCIVCSVPINGIYELIEYSLDGSGNVRPFPITRESNKNNVRPYFIDGDDLVWMNGDYYDWIVSSRRPEGYCTGIRSLHPIESVDNEIRVNNRVKKVMKDEPFNVSFKMDISPYKSKDNLIRIGNLTYSVDSSTWRPYISIGNRIFQSSNILGTSDCWARQERGTNGRWPAPEPYESVILTIVHDGKNIKTYINGLLDQNVSAEGFEGGRVRLLSKDLNEI